MRNLTQLVILKIDPGDLWPYCNVLLSLTRPDLFDLIKRYIKLLQVLYQNYAICDPIDVVMADIEELQIAQPSKVSTVYLLKFVVADVDSAYAFTEEKIREAGDVVVTEIYPGELDHLREEVFVGLIRDD